ncbi:hypothetical protein [Sinorhizobium meliloti]|uniref:hypothetical protein n=1 Tax=Rhizobium meliloti TaxID=382 RepID=UPI000EFC4A99|nr:hypothetical protein [Sinorhizobium meliloti]RMI14777.1 hypothetical protein DA102_033430 [Sinorhizobium meliloti]
MSLSPSYVNIVGPEGNILTVQEALEPLYMKLDQEVEVKLLEAAVSAGWTVGEALEAIIELKRCD